MSGVRLVDVPLDKYDDGFVGGYAHVPGLDEWLMARQVNLTLERVIRRLASEGMEICWDCIGTGEERYSYHERQCRHCKGRGGFPLPSPGPNDEREP